MENTQSSFTLGSSPVAPVSGQVGVVVNATDIDRLRGNKDVEQLGNLALHAIAAGEQVPGAVLQNIAVLVLEVDPANPESLSRISDIRSRLPSLTIIAALRDADVSLVRTLLRQGVADVVQLPFDIGELQEQIRNGKARASSALAAPELAKLLTIVGSTGGCGATTVVTHLAAAIAALDGAGRKVCVIDLDLQGGEVVYYVGLDPVSRFRSCLRLATGWIRNCCTAPSSKPIKDFH